MTIEILCNFDTDDFIRYITRVSLDTQQIKSVVTNPVEINIGSHFSDAESFDVFENLIDDVIQKSARVYKYVYPQNVTQFILDFCKKYACSDKDNMPIRRFIQQTFYLEDYFEIATEILRLTYFNYDERTTIDIDSLFGKFIKYARINIIDYNIVDFVAKKYPKKFYYLVRNVVLQQIHTIIKLLNNNLSLLDHDIFSKCYSRIIRRYCERYDDIPTNNEIILKMYVDHNEAIGTNYSDIIDTLLDAYIYFIDGLRGLNYDDHKKIIRVTANTITTIQNYCNNYIADSTDHIIRKKLSDRYGSSKFYYHTYAYFTCAKLVDFRIEDLLTAIDTHNLNGIDVSFALVFTQYYIRNGNNFDPPIYITFDIANNFFLDKISYIELYKRFSDSSAIINSVIKVYPNLFTDAEYIYSGHLCSKKMCKFIKATESIEKYGFDFMKLVEINPVTIATSIYALDHYIKKFLTSVTILSTSMTIDPLSKSNNDYSVYNYRQQFIDTLGPNNITTITKFITEHTRNRNVDTILSMLKIIDIVDVDVQFVNVAVTLLFRLSYINIHIIGTNFFYSHYSIDGTPTYLHIGNFDTDTMCLPQIKYYDALYVSKYDYIMAKYIISRYSKFVIDKVGTDEYIKHFSKICELDEYLDPAIIMYHAKKIMSHTMID